jgi:hypothetical protein
MTDLFYRMSRLSFKHSNLEVTSHQGGSVEPPERMMMMRKLSNCLLGTEPTHVDRQVTDRYSIMAMLLGDQDEKFLLTARGGSPDLAARFRQDRRRIYFGYIRSFKKCAQKVQMERLRLRTASFADLMRFDVRLSYCVGGMAVAGALHLLHAPRAREVAEYYLDQALPFIYPTAKLETA